MGRVRAFRPSDAPALAQIFYDAIHIGAAPVYDAKARAAWCPKVPDGPGWSARLSDSVTFVADERDHPVGFMSVIADQRHIDLAFVHPDHLRKGVATELCQRIETHSLSIGLTRLTTDASLMAEPMFMTQGWRVIEHQKIKRHGVILRNCLMEKRL